jgi:hypothetical protein
MLIKVYIQILISRHIDQEIRNNQARDYAIYLVIDNRETIVLF